MNDHVGNSGQDLVLHHFDISPFAEKARKIMGLKGLAWKSVQIPTVMPKPDLMPITGGYRRTPVLQVGADIYCDTQLIARELERRFPDPTLFPAGDRGYGYALGYWSDRAFFHPGSALSMIENAPYLPEDILEDRKKFFTYIDFDRADAELPRYRVQFAAHAALLDDQLADGRDYVGGDAPGLADIQAHHVIWMARANIPSSGSVLARLRHIAPWEARMAALGEGKRLEISADDALAIARAATPAAGHGVGQEDPEGLVAGMEVDVTPDDYGRVPVRGRVVSADAYEVAIARHHDRTGDVVVHFPRIGFTVTPS